MGRDPYTSINFRSALFYITKFKRGNNPGKLHIGAAEIATFEDMVRFWSLSSNLRSFERCSNYDKNKAMAFPKKC